MLTGTLTETERDKVHSLDQEWSAPFAFAVTRADFEAAENFRTRNHDHRWALADELYAGYQKQKYWEGSKMPRSSLGQFVVLSQIESLLPKVLSSLFADNPWFEVGAEPGTTGIDALRVRGLMMRQMEQARRLKNQSLREVMRRGIKDGLLYGVGPVEIAWYDEVRSIRKIVRSQVNSMQMMQGVQVPSGQQQSQLMEQTVEQRIQCPYLRHISAKDCYVDPNHTNPQFQSARYVCTRGYMTVDELDALRGMEDYTIPARARLVQMSKTKPSAQADSYLKTSVTGEDPNVDSSLDAGAGRIEVIARWSADRCTWILNREELAYNARNRYGFIPIFNAFYIDFPGRAYGLSVADVTEGEHRLQGAVVNARVDELALHIHGRTVKKRGTSTPTGQLKRRPGQVIEEDMQGDVRFDQINPALQQGFMEVQASEMRVQKTTGVTDMAVMGVQSSGGNSANRTATGVGVQAQAAFSRLTYIVENIEDTFVEPILSAWHYMNTQFLDPDTAVQIIGADGIENHDPLLILNADVVFTMRASSKMQSRQALMQALPVLSQVFMNPAIMAHIQQMGLTIDFEEFSHVVLDATGYKARGQFIRKMTPEEQQALAESKKQENDIELVKQRERFAFMAEMQEDKSADDMNEEVVKIGLDSVLNPPPPKAPPGKKKTATKKKK